MSNSEKVIEGLEWILKDDRFGFGVNWETGEPRDDYEIAGKIITNTIALLKEQPQIVLCKDCVHRGNAEKCVLAAIAAEKGYPLFMLDNRGEWYCADGERSVK